MICTEIPMYVILRALNLRLCSCKYLNNEYMNINIYVYVYYRNHMI